MKRILIFLLISICLLTLPLSIQAKEKDKADLEALLNENYDASLYTSESYGAYQKALNNALTVYQNVNANVGEIAIALLKLQTAKAGLKPILHKGILLSYVENLEMHLYDIVAQYPEEITEKIVNARARFLALYSSENLTEEDLKTATAEYTTLILEINQAGSENESFSSEENNEIILPDGYGEDPVVAGEITRIRITMVIVGSVFAVLGIAAVILYFKPPKFLK